MEVERESHLLDELEKLRLSGPRSTRERPHTSSAFTPLLDIPVDGYNTETRDPIPPSASPLVPNWLLAHHSDYRTPLRSDIGTIRSIHFDEVSLHSASDKGDTISDRGRSLFKNGHSKGKTEKSGEKSKDTVFTLQSAPHRTRPPLSHVFGSGLDSDTQVGSEQVNGHQGSSENGLNGSAPVQEYELKTVSISKTKQSLGKLSFDK